MKNFNEEDYLESLLKSMDKNVEESDEDKEERLIQEQIKEAVKNSNSKTREHMIDYYENIESEVLEELAATENIDNNVINTNVINTSINDTSINDTSINGASKTGQDPTGVINDAKITLPELGEEYTNLFEPEDSNFKISDIPDREPTELTKSEMDRLATMNLDGILNDVANESVSVNQLFSSADNNSKLNEDNHLIDKEILEAETVASIVRSAVNDKDSSNIDSAIVDIKQKEKSNKNNSENKKNNKKKSILKFIKNIFFEELEQESDQNPEELTDENQRVLQELYGSNAQDKFNNDNDYKGDNEYKSPNNKDDNENVKSKKKGFFAKRKEKSAAKKTKVTDLAKAEEDVEALEIQKKKKLKEEKNIAKKNKKLAAKNAKAAKPKKQKAVKKPKKEKKPKAPTRPQDMIKIKPISLFFLVSFVAGVVVLIEISNTVFYYNNGVSKAQMYFQAGNYQKAYDSLQGMDLKSPDEKLYQQISTIMYVQKQYTSYQNYVKLGRGIDALDSLIKGVQRYYTYYPTAKELGVSEQLDATKAEIVSALKSTFSMSEEKAISYASLSDINFTQYYYTLESYGGLVSK